MAKPDWIKGAIKHPGALHSALGVPQGKTIPENKLMKAARGAFGKKTAARARFAEQLANFHKK